MSKQQYTLYLYDNELILFVSKILQKYEEFIIDYSKTYINLHKKKVMYPDEIFHKRIHENNGVPLNLLKELNKEECLKYIKEYNLENYKDFINMPIDTENSSISEVIEHINNKINII